jgi:hypothetical protein
MLSASPAGSDAYDASRFDRQRSLDAMHVLETAAGGAAPGREEAWQAEVLVAIRQLAAALAEQERSYDDPANLLAEIAQEHPRLRIWVRQLRRQWHELAATTQSLADRLEHADEAAWNFADIREQLRWLITALHHHRAREADLVFEALNLDLGIGD